MKTPKDMPKVSRMRDLGGGIKAPRYGVSDKVDRIAGRGTEGMGRHDELKKGSQSDTPFDNPGALKHKWK